MFAGCFIEDLYVFKVGVCAETSVGWQCPWSGGPVVTILAHTREANWGSQCMEIDKQSASRNTYHANKHVFGSLTSGNVTTTAGSWTSL